MTIGSIRYGHTLDIHVQCTFLNSQGSTKEAPPSQFFLISRPYMDLSTHVKWHLLTLEKVRCQISKKESTFELLMKTITVYAQVHDQKISSI